MYRCTASVFILMKASNRTLICSARKKTPAVVLGHRYGLRDREGATSEVLGSLWVRRLEHLLCGFNSWLTSSWVSSSVLRLLHSYKREMLAIFLFVST